MEKWLSTLLIMSATLMTFASFGLVLFSVTNHSYALGVLVGIVFSSILIKCFKTIK